jgi:hypothetical protein
MCYNFNLPLTFSQTNSTSNYDREGFADIEYPSFWDTIEVPEINGVVFLSPLKSVGVILQNLTGKINSPEEIYTNLILQIRQNLNGLNIININNTESSEGSSIDTVEYSYGNDSKKFRVIQVLENGKNKHHLFTYFSEDIFYDRFIPIVSPMKNTFVSFDVIDKKDKDISKAKNQSILKSQTNLEKPNKDPNITNSKASTSSQSDKAKISTYKNPYLGISLQYPSSIKKIEKDNGVSFFIDKGTSGILIGVIHGSTDSTEDFISKHISNFESSLQNFQLVNMSQVNIFSNPTQLLFFNYDNNSKTYNGMEYITMEGSDAYIFSYFSRADTFDRYLPVFSNLVDTTQLRNLPRIG